MYWLTSNCIGAIWPAGGCIKDGKNWTERNETCSSRHYPSCLFKEGKKCNFLAGGMLFENKIGGLKDHKSQNRALMFICRLESWASLLSFCVFFFFLMEKCFQILLFWVMEQKTPKDPCLVHCSLYPCSLSALPIPVQLSELPPPLRNWICRCSASSCCSRHVCRDFGSFLFRLISILFWAELLFLVQQ